MEKKKRRMRPLGVILRILAGLLALLLLAALVLTILPMTETVEKTALPGAADWMAPLPNERSLNALAIPGTHDSATQYVQLAYFSKCQASGISTQLADGFRYLDIRLGEDKGEAVLYHGFCKCREGLLPWSKPLSLQAVLADCYAFLDLHPGETIVFAVMREHGGTDEWAQTVLKAAADAAPDKWYLSDSLPTLGECRGKLVLMRRWEDVRGLGQEAGIRMIWPDQNDRDAAGADPEKPTSAAARAPQETYTLLVQDHYKYDTERKWTAFLNGLAAEKGRAADDSGRPLLRLNFLSTNGSPAYGHPYKYAKALNPRTPGLLAGFDPAWVIFDFSDGELAQRVWSRNFEPGAE